MLSPQPTIIAPSPPLFCITYISQMDFVYRDYQRFAAEFGDDLMVVAEQEIDTGSEGASDDGEMR